MAVENFGTDQARNVMLVQPLIFHICLKQKHYRYFQSIQKLWNKKIQE